MSRLTLRDLMDSMNTDSLETFEAREQNPETGRLIEDTKKGHILSRRVEPAEEENIIDE